MKKIKDFLTMIDLKMFDDPNMNATSNTELSDEMKTYYSDYLIDTAEPKLVHDQFAQKHPIPKNGGKTIEFRKWKQLPKQLTPLTEGVTPDGQKMEVTKIEATISQYGGYVTLTDILQMTAIDNALVEATRAVGGQAGRTLDTITREVLNGGTNVMYAPIIDGSSVTDITSRSSITEKSKMTVDLLRRAVTYLKGQLAEPVDGKYYVAIMHPDLTYDLWNDPEFVEAAKYGDPEKLFTGEIGRIAGVRIIETTEAKIFANAGATSGDSKVSVYSTLVMGADAYGVTEIEGGGLQHIVKQLGSSGTADPLNQRSTVGWKATKVAKRLVEEFMIRIESCGSFNPKAAAN